MFLVAVALGIAIGVSSVISPVIIVIIIAPIILYFLYRRPLLGVVLIAFMLPLEVFVIGDTGNSLIQYIGFLAFSAGLLKLLTMRGKRIRFPGWAIAFVVTAWLTSLLQGIYGAKLFTYVMLLGLYWLVENYATDFRAIQKILVALIAGALFSVPLGLIQGIGMKTIVAGHEVVRFAGGIKDPNDYAGILVVSFGILIGFMTNNRNNKLKSSLYIVLSCIILLATMTTYSRGGFIALVFVVLVWLWSIGLKFRILLIGSAISGMALRVIALLPGLSQRFASILTPAGVDNRIDLWSRAIIWVLPRHPLLGVGAGRFPEALRTYAPIGRINVAHNMFLSVAVESGLIALIPFMIAILPPFFTLLFNIKTSMKQQPNNTVAIPVLLGTAGALMAGQFLTWDYEKVLWLMVGLCSQVCWLSHISIWHKRESEARVDRLPRSGVDDVLRLPLQ